MRRREQKCRDQRRRNVCRHRPPPSSLLQTGPFPKPRLPEKTDYAPRRIKTVFSFSRRWTATRVLTSRRGQGAPRSACRGDEGSLPEVHAANSEYSFILLLTPADKRSGRVSGALRGGQGRETGRGARALDSSLATRHLSVPSCPSDRDAAAGFETMGPVPSGAEPRD